MAKKPEKKEGRIHTEPKVKNVDYRQFLKWVAVYDLETLKALFQDKKLFAFDTETTGLDYLKLKIAGFSITFDGITGYYIPIAHKKDRNAPRECLDFVVGRICDDDVTVFMWNKKYDLNVLEISEGYELGVRRNVRDIQILVWLRDTNWAMPSLKWASEHFLGFLQPRYDDVSGDSTFDYAMVADVCEYAALDAICTYRLAMSTIDRHPKLRAILNIDDISVEAIRKFEHHKIRLDVDWLRKEESRIMFLLKDLEKQAYAMVGYEFNINSTIQTAEALLMAGCQLTAKTATGKWVVSEDVISALDHPIAKILVQHSQMTTYLGTFVRNLITYADEESKIRFNYKHTSAVTGRFSSGGDDKNSYYAGVNAQNIPKPKQIEVAMVPSGVSVTGWEIMPLEEVVVYNENREIVGVKDGAPQEFYVCETGSKEQAVRCAFLPDDDESVWVSIDYAGQELRIAANFSGEPVFVEAFLHGGDPHMTTAKKIWGSHADKNHRRMAKGANFALQYGGSAYTLKENLGVTKAEAETFYQQYCEAMPVLISWQSYMKKLARRDGVVSSAFGRPFRLGRYFKDGISWKMQSYGERCALNYPVQGTGGDVIRIALGRVLDFWEAMKQRGLNGFTFLSTVHDEINFSVKKTFLPVFMKNVPRLMRMHFPEWKVPLEIDISIGHNWSECVSYKYEEEAKTYTPKGDYYNFKLNKVL